MITTLILWIVLLTPIALFIWALISVSNSKERTRKLFEEEIYPMCNKAMTAQEIKDAFEQLHLKCLDIKSMQDYKKKGGAMFTIDIAWKQDFYNLKANLNGRWQMLSKEEKDATRKW